MSNINIIEEYLDTLIPDPKCELQYKKDYELLIATVLSAQSTDKRVNSVTPVLFDKYDSLEKLENASLKDIEFIIKPVGTYKKKAVFIKSIAYNINHNNNGFFPKKRKILLTYPGVGRKTTNVVLNELYDIPAIAVDTHVERVIKRLGLAKNKDNVLEVEEKLKRKIKRVNWGRRHKQLVLFGRYYCKAVKPNCSDCNLKNICKFYKSL